MFWCHSLAYSFAADGLDISTACLQKWGEGENIDICSLRADWRLRHCHALRNITGAGESLGVLAPTATALGALGGAMVAYLANRRFTFSSVARHRRALPRFFVVAALGAGLNSLIVWVGTSALIWHYLAAQAVATVVILALTYHLNRSWTFIC